MPLATWKSRYQKAKHYTHKVKRYLAHSSAQAIGSSAWQERFGRDPYTCDYNTITARELVTFAEIAANNHKKAPYVCKMFLEHLDEAIDLREYQNEKHKPCDKDEEDYKQRFLTHLFFIDQLRTVRTWARVLMNLQRISFTKNESTPSKRLLPSFQLLSVGGADEDGHATSLETVTNPEPSQNSTPRDSTPEQSLDSVSRDPFTDALISLIKDLADVRAVVEMTCTTYSSRTRTVLTLGLNMNLLYCFFEQLLQDFVLTHKESLRDFPIVQKYAHCCRDTGLASLVHITFLMHEKALVDAHETDKLRLEAAKYAMARGLFMPAVRVYLHHWIYPERRNLAESQRPALYAMPFLLEDGTRLSSNTESERCPLEYEYMWKYQLSEDLVREYHRQGTIEEVMGQPFFTVADRLTRLLPSNLTGNQISDSTPFMLHLLLEVHQQLEADVTQTRSDTTNVAHHIQDVIEAWNDLSIGDVPRDLPPEMSKAREIACEFLEDAPRTQAQLAQRVTPVPYFYANSNPVLNGVQAFGMLHLLQRGMAEVEAATPYIKTAVHLYKMIQIARSTGDSHKISWPDIDYTLMCNNRRSFPRYIHGPVTKYGFHLSLKAVLTSPGSASMDQIPASNALLDHAFNILGKKPAVALAELKAILAADMEQELGNNVDGLRTPDQKPSARTPSRRPDVTHQQPKSPSRPDHSPIQPKAATNEAILHPHGDASATAQIASPQPKNQHSTEPHEPASDVKTLLAQLAVFDERLKNEEFHLYVDYLQL
jgi:hypothetical protein